MGLAEMTSRGLSFSYKVLGEDAQFTLPGAPSHTTPRVIFSQDGVIVADGMAQSIGPSVRIRASDAPQGVPRGSLFALAGGSWKAREAGLPHNDGSELIVQLGKA
jgi:hypothetical protein